MTASIWKAGWTALALTAALTATLASAPGAHAGTRIVNGLNTQDFPTTGALLYSGGAAISPANAASQCTGTLIGCQTFLTAAHCVDDTTASHYWVYLQNGGLHVVSSITAHPSYNSNLSAHDIAIVKLSAPVTGIDPTTINSTHDLDAMGVGLGGIVAGFGRTGSGSDYGVKRYGGITTADCDTGATNGEGNDRLVCWNYDSTVGAPGTDSNTCNGDSGGPLFMTFSGSEQIVGVTSAGTATNCGVGDHSWDASVYFNAAWIAGQIGADSTAACGSIPPVGDPMVTTTADSGTLSSGNTSDAFEVTLTGAPQLVRFTLNGTDDGSFNPNFFVKQGSGASAANFDCKADAASVFGACEFASPAAGTWSVFVQRGAGSGEYQVTTTVFGGDPPVCGDNAATGNEECDGTDDTACPGACLGDCSCPAPVCGDNAATGAEQCDGSDDAACPGACLGDCSCPQACTTGPLYFLTFVSDAARFSYKAQLRDDSSTLGSLDPHDAAFELSVTDGTGLVDLSIPANDAGWIKVDPVRRKYGWKGDGGLDGLTRVKLVYKATASPPYWLVNVKGKAVTGAGSIDLVQAIDFRLGVDGTCHLETW